MEIDRREGHLAHDLQAKEDHPGHPEEDDLVARLHHRAGVEAPQVVGLLRPPEGGEGPKPRAEPGVEHVPVLLDRPSASRARGEGLLRRDGHLAAVAAVPDRDPVPPPELARDAPVVDVFEPVQVDALEALRHERHPAIVRRLDCRRCKRRHLDEPLLADQGLDHRVAPLAMPNGMSMRLHLDQRAVRLQPLNHPPPCFGHRHPGEGPGGLVHRAVQVHHERHREAVPAADLEVVGIVGRGHLHRPGAERRIHRLVRDNRNLPIHNRQPHRLADEMRVAGVLRVDRHSGVAQHRLRPRRGDDHYLAVLAALDRVGEVPERRLLLAVDHLEIRQRRHAPRAPGDDPLPPVDQPLVVEVLEDVPNRAGRPRIHREVKARPVAGSAQDPKLLPRPTPVAVHVGPDPFQEPFPPQIVAGQPLPRQFLLHDPLAGDPGVVGTREPKCRLAEHPVETGHHVFNGDKERVADVQLAGQIRRGHDHHPGLAVTLGRREIASRVPPVVQPLLDRLRIERLGQTGLVRSLLDGRRCRLTHRKPPYPLQRRRRTAAARPPLLHVMNNKKPARASRRARTGHAAVPPCFDAPSTGSPHFIAR